MHDELLDGPRRATARGPASSRFLVLALIGALVLGAALALWAANRVGWVNVDRAKPVAAKPLARSTSAPAAQAAELPAETAQAALGVRLAELEQRMTQLNLQAAAASGNAARAEGLLIAFAARRTIERGAPLGYLESQLKLRFGNAQPNAVETLVGASGKPVTLDVLAQGLHALEPALARAPSDADAWTRVRSEFAQLFVVRRVGTPSPAPARRLERARTYLETGRVEAAIGEVQRMPGAAAARDWLALAQRYVQAQRALDLIETAAILEPRQLKDAEGVPVAMPSPLAGPQF
ncbi:MAG TPA: hypothetical protein VM055_00095 [Novosphingobium sp.]|nr:hypothetical protein [Novosphingobium sp.]